MTSNLICLKKFTNWSILITRTLPFQHSFHLIFFKKVLLKYKIHLPYNSTLCSVQFHGTWYIHRIVKPSPQTHLEHFHHPQTEPHAHYYYLFEYFVLVLFPCLLYFGLIISMLVCLMWLHFSEGLFIFHFSFVSLFLGSHSLYWPFIFTDDFFLQFWSTSLSSVEFSISFVTLSSPQLPFGSFKMLFVKSLYWYSQFDVASSSSFFLLMYKNDIL